MLEFAALVVAGACIVGVVLVQAWQVFARYVLNDSPSWTEPMALVPDRRDRDVRRGRGRAA